MMYWRSVGGLQLSSIKIKFNLARIFLLYFICLFISSSKMRAECFAAAELDNGDFSNADCAGSLYSRLGTLANTWTRIEISLTIPQLLPSSEL